MSASSTKNVTAALTRYRVMAYTTGFALAFMTVVGLPYKFIVGGHPIWYAMGWMFHGWAYIIYVAVALDLIFRLRWDLLRALAVVLAGTIPFMSFVAERRVTRAVEAKLAAADATVVLPQAAPATENL